ncbi:NOL1/NOP2/sun family putative RNA methylase [Permianibacter sp. IMCC34836]|uniref:NOL1/NOP2/sun family putative RNA methylase n=1 Tax=Permianibacter fluminis TaxID=2738515 RepID=UPI001556E80B|nr:NOL1/NOP2/sun family putative RNA methylase [Permianibacter fluminis]NQD36488.1 NOL1/NOP2/sun family putative RNA methylase [Permianibacter fluminis]
MALADFEHYLRQHLSATEIDALMACNRTPLRPCLRTNPLRAGAELPSFFDECLQRNNSVPWWPQAFWYQAKYPENEFALGNSIEHLSGQFYIQEASSMLPVAALLKFLDTDTATVLDMCAAPGSKTTQLAAALNNRGTIIANELSASRLKTLSASLLRCGVSNTALCHLDARRFGELAPETFDAILLDAPCTGEGTVRKDPGALNNWNLGTIETTAALQRELIASAFHALKPGGVLVYSTCTINRIENHDVCRWLLQTFAGMAETLPLDSLFPGAERAATPEGWLWLLPQIFDSEGFFVAAFRKTGSTETAPGHPRKAADFAYAPLSRRLSTELLQHWRDGLGVDATALALRLYVRDETVYLLIEQAEHWHQRLQINRFGLPVAELHKNGMRSLHSAAIVLAPAQDQDVIAVSREAARHFLMGRDIDVTAGGTGERRIQFDGVVLGLGKLRDGRLKNGYPRDFVNDRAR